MKKTSLSQLLLFSVLWIVLVFPGQMLAKDKIIIGQTLALSGPTAGVTKILEQAAIKLWLEEIEKKGGIYVKELGQRLPVELLRYDNKGDISTMLKMVKKLITVDKVDFLLPPWGSDMHFAMLPVANKAGYPIVTWTVVSEKLYDQKNMYPYIFHMAPPPSIHMEHGMDLFKEMGIKTAAIIRNSLDLLTLLDLFEQNDLKADSLPYAMQRRLEIARALATRPFLLLLDEPAAGMNPQETKDLEGLILRIREVYGLSILIIEHDMKLVMRISDRVFVMNQGKKIIQDLPEKVQLDEAVIQAYLGET